MDSVLVISLATICSGIVIIGLKLCFKSKCSDVNLCGLVTIHRNIELELQLENNNNNKNNTDDTNSNKNNKSNSNNNLNEV